MTALYDAWVAGGKPFTLAQPIADFARTLRSRGYTVGTIGNASHLQARMPEDHTPYSRTGWPNPQPYPIVHALDIMAPADGSGLPSLAALGAQIVGDRNANTPGTLWIKYINWTRSDGKVVHESWEPVHDVRASSDTGHIHISGRTDFTQSTGAATYDPVATLLGRTESAPVANGIAPAWPGRLLRYPPVTTGDDVRRWQAKMHDRGWTRMQVDGKYGPISVDLCRQFQQGHGLHVDGIVGPRTWDATWR